MSSFINNLDLSGTKIEISRIILFISSELTEIYGFFSFKAKLMIWASHKLYNVNFPVKNNLTSLQGRFGTSS